ncbi:MAG TPA: D-alanyl-D-alanine carboxypeptidase/D-alanyl-D-alanine-endopeptidase [Candidatus Eremiobacteraceae bacterium]|nr:D-alanyl-D-alanine carboxypeptidase/D-alanyl-D-alanine-endopeptidase [Candidatus Eremiobacteraceae bacterium]
MLRRNQTAILALAILLCAAGASQTRAQAPSAQPSSASANSNRSVSAATSTERFADRAEKLLQAPPIDKGEWGLLIVDASSGETLYQNNADKYFVPASNMKLLTTALALDTLGPDYRFRTTLETNGTLAPGGKLSGDLLLVGRGDPNLSNRKFPFDTKEEFDGPPEKALAELADLVTARGVNEITGDIVGDDSYFPRERYPDGWEIDDMVWDYGAAISAIVVDDNTVTLVLTPGERPGDPVQSSLEPAEQEFEVKNTVVTAAAKDKSDLRLVREPGSNTVVVSGTLPARSSPRKLVLAIQEPAEHGATLLQHLLVERGVKVDGNVRVQHDPDAAEASRTILAEHLSIRLADSVKLVNKISQNLHAEVLLRTAARQTGRWTDPEDLWKFPQQFYAKVGIGPDDVVQTDGSGLSRHDIVTPRALVTLLQYTEKQPWFQAFYASLPVAGVDGTLNERMKEAALAGRIHAKTGSVSHVRTLTGFAETVGGRRLIFSFMSNNAQAKNHEVPDALDALCQAMIEEFDEKKEIVKQ